MNQQTKRYILNLALAYAALALTMALIGFALIPAGAFALILLNISLPFATELMQL